MRAILRCAADKRLPLHVSCRPVVIASPTPYRCRYDAGSRPIPTAAVGGGIFQEQRVIGLIQRVSEASVEVDGRRIAAIGRGLLVLVGVERADGEAEVRRLLERLLSFRVFDDAGGRMNLDVREAGGELLLVPQFTLAADTAKGNRPGFSKAADPELGRVLFGQLVEAARAGNVPVAAGVFGATMRVALCNEGPATFWLQVPARG